MVEGKLGSHWMQIKLPIHEIPVLGEKMAVDKHPSGVKRDSTEQTFGGEVHDLLRTRFGQPVLSKYEDIQKLKSADRGTTLALLFGVEAAAFDRFQGARPEDVVNEFSDRLAQMQTAMQEQGRSEVMGTAFTGMLQILGEALATLG